MINPWGLNGFEYDSKYNFCDSFPIFVCGYYSAKGKSGTEAGDGGNGGCGGIGGRPGKLLITGSKQTPHFNIANKTGKSFHLHQITSKL